MTPTSIIAAVLVFIALYFLAALIMFFTRYKKCPPDRIMVVYGKTPNGRASKCIHGGATFVWPVIQDWGYISIRPIKMDISPQKIYCKGKEYIDFKINTVVAVNPEPDYMTNAAHHLFGQHPDAIDTLASETFINLLKSYTATVSKEEIENDLGMFTDKFREKSEAELKELGFTIKSLSIDIK